MKIIRGSYLVYKEQLMDLFTKHWEEIGLVGAEDLHLSIDESIYAAAEFSNTYLGLALEDKGKLIGYLSFFIYSHPHHAGIKFASTDCFFIVPEKRGFTSGRIICTMFKMAEKILKDEFKVEYIQLIASTKNKLKNLAEFLQYRESDIIYIKKV